MPGEVALCIAVPVARSRRGCGRRLAALAHEPSGGPRRADEVPQVRDRASRGSARRRRSSRSAPSPASSRCAGRRRSSRPRTRSRSPGCRASPSSAAGRAAGSPDWLSGTCWPTAHENAAVPTVFDRRRTGGIRAKSRRPTISSGRGPDAPGAANAATNRGISSGSCWPSASSVTTASQPSSSAQPEPGPQRGALALVRDLADHVGPGGLGDRRRVVGRAVVDDEDRQVAPRRLDHRADPRTLLVARDEREDARPRAASAVVTARAATERRGRCARGAERQAP